ncbi:MAG: hypothetical protein KID00_06605 [Clostridium argentinense]|uniref:hypothetical protein n=1 Tax=Clostridium butanoliproducens TaxID=2991837 RepID=UPI001DDDEFAC|nr:hypothetical protein [Clostridium butanoliproducens]MBS5823519.1 hypothetical protein [Clostridium argentinense]
MINLVKTIKTLPEDSVSLIEDRKLIKGITLIVIKDCTSVIEEYSEHPTIAFRGAFINNNKVKSLYLLIKIKGTHKDGYYTVWFNYNDAYSLKIMINLVKQKNIFIVLADNDNTIQKTVTLENTLKEFFKEYLDRCSSVKCRWTKRDFEIFIGSVRKKYPNNLILWEKLGCDI